MAAIQGTPVFTPSATQLVFGNVVYGSSATQGLSIKNTGSAPLAVTSISGVGNAAGSPHTCAQTGIRCRYVSPAAARFFLTGC